MSVETFIITIYYLVDDLYKKLIVTPLKRRGPSPKLSDVELLSMEITGEWMGYHQDKAIWQYFRRHWLLLFPSISERGVVTELINNIKEKLIGDKGYISPRLKDECLSQDVLLETPLCKNMTDKRPKAAVSLMMRFRRRIETLIGQWVHYFDIEHIKCKDFWHLTSRIYRKLLSYTQATSRHRIQSVTERQVQAK